MLEYGKHEGLSGAAARTRFLSENRVVKIQSTVRMRCISNEKASIGDLKKLKCRYIKLQKRGSSKWFSLRYVGVLMEFSKYVENAIKVNGKVLNGKLIEIVKWQVGEY